MGNIHSAGGGSMTMILGSLVVVAGVAIYILDPVLFWNMVSTVARWLHFGQ